MSLLEKLAGQKKTPRSVPPSATLPLIPATQADTEDAQMAKAEITYHKGTGKENKAEYRLGRVSIPAAVVSRTSKAIKGLNESKAAMEVYSRLKAKYSSFLDELDKAEIDYLDAFKTMDGLKPAKFIRTGSRASRVAITANAVAKSICRRFKGNPEEMVTSFLEVVNGPEFRKEVTDIIRAYQKNFGVTTLGFTKTSDRKGNPKAMKALENFRKKK